MRERGIIFSGPMVRALLSGKKSQTRRVVKYSHLLGEPVRWCAAAAAQEPGWVRIVGDYRRFCHLGDIGGRLWVRETWRVRSTSEVAFRADCLPHEDERWRWRSPLFLPRDATRILLEITELRVERLQDISQEDAVAEGLPLEPVHWTGGLLETPKDSYLRLWDEINGKRAPAASNPWVWVITFKVVSPSRVFPEGTTQTAPVQDPEAPAVTGVPGLARGPSSP